MNTPSNAAGFVSTRLPFTQAEDWVIHHPRMTGPAMLLYMRLRSTTYEKTVQKKAKVFTVEQMRGMVPGERGRNSSASNVRKHLKLLQDIGALRRTNPEQKNATPVYEFPAQPPEGYTGWLSGYDWAHSLTDPGAAPTAPTGEGAAPAAGGAAPAAPGNAPAAGGAAPAAPTPPPTSQNEAPKKSFKNSSKNPPQERAGAGGAPQVRGTTGTEEEETGFASQAPTPDVEPSAEAVRLVGSEMRLMERESREVAALVDRACALGYAAAEVVRAFKRKVGPRAHSPVAICRGVASEHFSERPLAPRAKRFVQPSNRWDCPDCHGDLFVPDAEGYLTVKCFHPRLSPTYT